MKDTSALVLVTRPAAAALETAERLRKAGFTALCEPMLVFEVLSDAPLPAEPYACILISSSYALDALKARRDLCLSEGMLGLPCYCVGTSTAQAARAFGFERVIDCQGTASDMAARALGACDGAALHIGSEHVSDDPAISYKRAGRRLHAWPVYRMNKSDALSPSVREALNKGALFAALFYSSRSARHFDELVSQEGFREACRGVQAFALSSNVALALAEVPFAAVTVAPEPREDSLLMCLSSFLSAPAPLP